MKRRAFSLSVAAAAMGLALVSGAWAQGAPTLDKEYKRLAKSVPVSVPAGKVEVIEFFSYACPHCNAFEPDLAAWVKKQPAGVVFRRVPVSFLMNAPTFQRLYYTLETLGWLDKMHGKVFEAVHVAHRSLEKEDEVAALVAEAGLDKAKFLEVFRSFSIQTRVNQTKALQDAVHLESVPTLVVQGQYVTSPAAANGHEGAVATLDYLIRQVNPKIGAAAPASAPASAAASAAKKKKKN